MVNQLALMEVVMETSNEWSHKSDMLAFLIKLDLACDPSVLTYQHIVDAMKYAHSSFGTSSQIALSPADLKALKKLGYK